MSHYNQLVGKFTALKIFQKLDFCVIFIRYPITELTHNRIFVINVLLLITNLI